MKLTRRTPHLAVASALSAVVFATAIERLDKRGTVEPAAVDSRTFVAQAAEVIAAPAAAVAEMAAPAPMLQEPEPEWDLPNLQHERVDYWVERFSTDKRDDFSKFLARKPRYEAMITARLEERGMPKDLLYLAMIESGFNPSAYSRAHAAGLWQFIEPTAERYGLKVTRKVDERKNPEKSTEAALEYLDDLYDRFGSWYLAAAAYNTGENRVGRIMREETGSERGSEEDFYAIADRLPPETRDYVPLMIAAARISKDPGKYGFNVDEGASS